VVKNMSKRMYRAVIRESMSGVKLRYFSRTGNMTRMPPPGTAATANLAITKKVANIRYVDMSGAGRPKECMIPSAMMGMPMLSPIRWMFTVIGMMASALSGSPVFFSAPRSVSGMAAALDMVLKPAMAEGSTFLRDMSHFFGLKPLFIRNRIAM